MISNSNHIKTIFQAKLIWATTAPRSAVAKSRVIFFCGQTVFLFQFDETNDVFFYKKKNNNFYT